jgi:solute carrier family 9 (sodium/hydrogen exchanger), member 8
MAATTSEPPVDASAEQNQEVRGAQHWLAPAVGAMDVTVAQASMFLGIFLCLGVLVFGFLLVYLLRRFSVSWFPEAWVFFGLGLCIAGASSMTFLPDLGPVVSELRQSFPNVFFVMLLPPIIFESGYSLDKAPFFSNFGAICLFALLGTFVSTLVVAVAMWGVGAMGGSYAVGFLDALTFGAIISATDPVTVLAVFQELGVDRTLYALIFGESVLNDAVAIVLLHSLLVFQTESATASSGFLAVFSFLVVFVGSLAIGVGVGVLGALLFKHVALKHRHRPIERVLFALLPFVAYMLAEALRLSGVVAILFTGIATSHYTSRNVTASTRRFSRILFRMLASAAEALVFVTIGVATPPLLSSALAAAHSGTLWMGLLAVAVGRYATVKLCAGFSNLSRPAASQIVAPFPFVLWFSGLRGGVAFALAASSVGAMVDRTWAQVQEIVCLFIVVTTMISIGGTVGPLAGALGLSGADASSGGTTAVAMAGADAHTTGVCHNDAAAPTSLVGVDGTPFAAGGEELGAASGPDQRGTKHHWASRKARHQGLPPMTDRSVSMASDPADGGSPSRPDETGTERERGSDPTADRAVEDMVLSLRGHVTYGVVWMGGFLALVLKGVGLGLGPVAEHALGLLDDTGRSQGLWMFLRRSCQCCRCSGSTARCCVGSRVEYRPLECGQRRDGGEQDDEEPPDAAEEDVRHPSIAAASGSGASSPHPVFTVAEALRNNDAQRTGVVRSILQAAPSLEDLARFESRVLTPLFTTPGGNPQGGGAPAQDATDTAHVDTRASSQV